MSDKRKLDSSWFVVFACFLMSFFFLGFCSGNKGLFLSAITEALALPLETIMLSLFAAELFGTKAFPHTMGIFAAVNTAGYAAGTPIANLCYDAFGTYVPVILFYCGTMLAVTVVFQFILNAAYRERKRIMSVEVTQ
jgi:predicted MFS family arabinose efflux permease